MAFILRTPRLSSPGQIKPRGIPQIDWSHPLTGGLLFYGYDVGGTTIDLARGSPPTWVGTPDGQALTANGTGVGWANSSQYFASDAAMQSATAAGNFTWACAYIQTGTVGAYGRPFGRSANNGGSAPFLNYDFEINVGGGGQQIAAANYNGGGTNVTIGTWSSNANNVFTSLAASITSGGGGTYYAQGSQVGTSSGAAPASANTNDGVFFSGSSSAAASSNFSGVVFYGAFWSRVLSAGEVMLLHQDPYCFLVYDEGEWPSLFLSTGFTPKFRKTLSLYGSGVGKRQGQAA